MALFGLPKSIPLTYPMVHHHVRTPAALRRRSAQLFDWVRAGQLKVTVGRRYALADARQAHRDVESRETTGKLLLIP